MTHPRRAALIAGAVLVLQNAVVFFDHYLGRIGIPWDLWFDYPRTSFWITAAQAGSFPGWKAYHLMGYPNALDLQANRYYAPSWVVVALGIRYTLETAVALHGLHVLAGAVGAWLYLRSFFSAPLALVGAVAFQFFGGFYSNAEHADIVRAFALTPWLLWAVPGASGPLPARTLALPLLTFLLATGGYPGNLISTCWLLPAYAAARVFLEPGAQWRRALRQFGSFLALTALGLGMAAVHLGPPWLYRDQLLRHEIHTEMQHMGMPPEQLLTLYVSSRRMEGEPSMASTFVTLPIVYGLGLLTIPGLRRHWPRVVLLALSLGTVIGATSPWRSLLYELFPALGWSVQVRSDYRCFVAIAMIALGLEGFRGVTRGRLGFAAISVRSALWLAALAAGYRVQADWPSWSGIPSPVSAVALASVTAGSGLVCLAAALALSRRPGLGWPLAGVLAAALAQGGAVVADMGFTWRYPEKVNRAVLSTYDPQATGASVEPRPGPRPARTIPEKIGDWCWAGHIGGDYLMVDHTNGQLKAWKRAMDDPALREFMGRSWTAVLLDPPPAGRREELSLGSARPDLGLVTQTSYGQDEIEYRVELNRTAVLVENEIYFPGWTASLEGPGVEAGVRAFPVEGALRAWVLPEGRYRMRAGFAIPGASWFAAGSLLSFGLWLVLLVRSRRGHSPAPASPPA